MRCESPDTDFYAEVRGLNCQFLELVAAARDDPGTGRVLGLGPELVAALRALGSSQLEFIAGVPCLLAGFAAFPPGPGVAESPPTPVSVDTGWQRAAQLFAASLLTYLWQLGRRDRLLATLCVAPQPIRRRDLAALRIRDIQLGAERAVQYLRARQADHPRLWPDLIRAARSDDPQLRNLCRLRLIPLGLSALRPGAERPPIRVC
jgi:hypothetical protein